jgi:hypothetical protein
MLCRASGIGNSLAFFLASEVVSNRNGQDFKHILFNLFVFNLFMLCEEQFFSEGSLSIKQASRCFPYAA